MSSLLLMSIISSQQTISRLPGGYSASHVDLFIYYNVLLDFSWSSDSVCIFRVKWIFCLLYFVYSDRVYSVSFVTCNASLLFRPLCVCMLCISGYPANVIINVHTEWVKYKKYLFPSCIEDSFHKELQSSIYLISAVLWVKTAANRQNKHVSLNLHAHHRRQRGYKYS